MKFIHVFLFLLSASLFSQKNFSDKWDDLYSYNNVKDFTIVGNKIYAVSENAMFIYNIDTEKIDKFSSVNGLSGDTITCVSYDGISENIIIGYENGLLEFISNTNQIRPVTGIKNNLILVNKAVRGIYRDEDFSFVYGDFGVLELRINNFEIGDAFALSNSSTPTKVNSVLVKNKILYSATENGLYSIDISSNNTLSPIDLNNWTELNVGNISELILADGKVLFVKGKNVYSADSNPSLIVIGESDDIESLRVSDDKIIVTTSELINAYNINSYVKEENVIDLSLSTSHDFTTNKSILLDEELYLQSNNFGILTTSLSDKLKFKEIHPEGPTENSVFTITVKDNQKWVVYGGYETGGYNGLIRRKSIDFFDGEKWGSLPFKTIGSFIDCTKAIVDPFDSDKVLVGSYNGGVLELNNFNYIKNWGVFNTEGILPGHNEDNDPNVNWVSDIIVDNNNMVWTGNSRARNNKIFTMYDGSKMGLARWTQNVVFPRMRHNGGVIKGLNRMFVDKDNNILAGTRQNGLLVFNADPVTNESDRNFAVLNDLSNQGGLPSNEVLSVASDENGKIWIGTDLGLVVFDDINNLYNDNKRVVNKVIIEEGGIAREFLGETAVNEIIIDGNNNKWFATAGAGVVYTSSDAQTTFEIFNTSNSPLPSNTVIDLELDRSTGLMYMVTDKGVLVYDTEIKIVSPTSFGNKVTPVVAYPNPAIRNRVGHELITIVAKDDNGIPEGTNIKILDISGKLVYETNVSTLNQTGVVGIIWDKRNLRGNLVASGIYIVLVSSPDGSENTTTKIAIVN